MIPHDDVATANEKLDRIIALLEQIAARNQPPFPMPAGEILDRLARMEAERNAPTDTRAFLDGLRGKTIDEIRAANRERNRRLKEAAT